MASTSLQLRYGNDGDCFHSAPPNAGSPRCQSGDHVYDFAPGSPKISTGTMCFAIAKVQLALNLRVKCEIASPKYGS